MSSTILDWADRSGKGPELSGSGYSKFLGMSPEQQSSLGAAGLTFDDSGNPLFADGFNIQGYLDQSNTLNTGAGLADWFGQNKDILDFGLGLANTGMSLYNMPLQREAAKQNIAASKQAMGLAADAAANKKNMEKKFQSNVRFT